MWYVHVCHLCLQRFCLTSHRMPCFLTGFRSRTLGMGQRSASCPGGRRTCETSSWCWTCRKLDSRPHFSPTSPSNNWSSPAGTFWVSMSKQWSTADPLNLVNSHSILCMGFFFQIIIWHFNFYFKCFLDILCYLIRTLENLNVKNTLQDLLLLLRISHCTNNCCLVQLFFFIHEFLFW